MARIAFLAVPFIKAEMHRELAERCVASIGSSHEVDTIAIVNAVRSENDYQWLTRQFNLVERNDANILARAWNRGIKLALARGAELVIVSNLDLMFHPACFDNLYECSRQNPDELIWSPLPWRDYATLAAAELRASHQPGITWSCFAVNQRLFEQLGEFDERYIPAYREDSDMEYRMKLRGLAGLTSHAALFFDSERGTIKGLFNCDSAEVPAAAAVLTDLRASITRNDQRYARKWGGGGGAERFTIPFDGGDEQ